MKRANFNSPSLLSEELSECKAPQPSVNSPSSASAATKKADIKRSRPLRDSPDERWQDRRRFTDHSNIRIVDAFEGLENSILTWSARSLPSSLSWDMVSRSDQRWLLEWAPKARFYIELEEYASRRSFLLAWSKFSFIAPFRYFGSHLP